MRKRVSSNGLTLQAIAGNHAIFLGFDLDDSARQDCLGFSIRRTDHDENESYWLSGFKTFRSVVPNPEPAGNFTTRDHPIQSFYWGDYSAKPGHRYTYRIVPRYGRPKKLEDRAGVDASVDVTTNDPTQGVHGVYFNRGVAASQAYSFKYGVRPDSLSASKSHEAMTWLSRGLVEALTDFINEASTSGFALRAAVYEFTEPSVLRAFRRAYEAGADVSIIYHARSDHAGESNQRAIENAGLDDAILIERTQAKIAHNKFVVLCRKKSDGTLEPVSVWTGSTNMSQGGIFGHSNVGHVVRDPAVAGRFLAYWDELSGDPDTETLRSWADGQSSFDPERLDMPGIHTLFSPRHGLAVLKWYAKRYGEADAVANITLAFGMGKVFEQPLVDYAGDAIHYVLLEKEDDNQSTWAADHKVMVAVGAKGGPDSLARWAKETLTGFNRRVLYMHTKILLIDPLGLDPTVITGSANFSPDSTSANDENMLIVRGDRDLADIYFTEYARIFIHFYARWWAKQLAERTEEVDKHGFLVETSAWQKPYFTTGNPKELQRTLFSSKVSGNEAD